VVCIGALLLAELEHVRKGNTAVCSFDKTNPKISAYGIHDWRHNQLHIEEKDVTTIQTGGQKM
jgi:hypothetical protein